jgi:hypothetical protein
VKDTGKDLLVKIGSQSNTQSAWVPKLERCVMQTITINLPETAFAALHKAPEEFAREMRVAAAVKWYELGEFAKQSR